jgi:hypothetical protein
MDRNAQSPLATHLPKRLFRIAAIALLVTGVGCQSGLFTAMYIIKGNMVDPEYAGLKGKKVVVVCRATSEMEFANIAVADELAATISRMLGQNVRRIEIIPPREVEKWTDENEWEEFTEVGKAVGAQQVVGVDLDQFGIYQGQTVYQGTAIVAIHVFDLEQDGAMVYNSMPPQTRWPPNSVEPVGDKLPAQFRKEFIQVLANEVGKHFYPHDPAHDFARDADAL